MRDGTGGLVRVVSRTLLLLLLLCGAPAGLHAQELTRTLTLSGLVAANERIVELSRENFDVQCRAAEEKWALELISTADAARRRLGEVTRDSLLVRIRMILAPTQRIFLQLTGTGAENSVAVSIGGQQLIIVNLEQLKAQGLEKVGGILVHELAHVYLDVRTKRPVPRWMHEGIAQSIAGDVTGSAASLLTARLVNRMITLAELEHRFPAAMEREQLAYRESYSVVQFLITERHDGSLPALLQWMTGENSANNLELLWSPLYRDALEVQWRKSLGGWRDWTIAIVSSGSFWAIIAVLTVIAYFVRRRRSVALRREWDEEERIYTVLDEEEKKIYGDEDPDVDPYARPGEYVDPEYEDEYENGEYRGTRKLE